jgi:hypothetical protein
MTINYSKSISSYSTYPTYTFKVDNLDMSIVYGNCQPDVNLENIIYQLKNATIWVPGVDRPLKHGDTFTLTGEVAERVKAMYDNQSPQTIQTHSIPDVSDLSLNIDVLTVTASWTGNELYYTEITITNNNTVTTDVLAKGSNGKEITVEEGTLEIKLRFTDGLDNFSEHYSLASTEVTGVVVPLVQNLRLFSWGKTIWTSWDEQEDYFTTVDYQIDETWEPAFEDLIPKGTYEI